VAAPKEATAATARIAFLNMTTLMIAFGRPMFDPEDELGGASLNRG
jgi:hypothetical protein